ncbi:hypothetical protein GMD78_14120 [Ornithinibacillus sp. L9]|uniref:Lipoprotein n=1 Tax=Ornithinibacillus caprae TaxID=2678566 RepID=A0A6N8FNX6_9BACI|nr:hypothetical protein [Ornithinibacillus caprae]MUK89499.1 hypothetical protein [Ornithinibacillus caprae]
MRNFISLSFLFLFIFLTACSGQHYKSLTRVEVQEVDSEENYRDTIQITDQETIEELIGIFKNIRWEPNTEPSIARKEDILLSLYYDSSNSTIEKQNLYRIWFSDRGTATLISDYEKEGYGGLNKEDVTKLKNILAN